MGSDFLRDVLTLSNPPHIAVEQREERLAFVMRLQQFTSPIVAKGFEDTALYIYYPLSSLNEVSGNLGKSRLIIVVARPYWLEELAGSAAKVIWAPVASARVTCFAPGEEPKPRTEEIETQPDEPVFVTVENSSR